MANNGYRQYAGHPQWLFDPNTGALAFFNRITGLEQLVGSGGAQVQAGVNGTAGIGNVLSISAPPGLEWTAQQWYRDGVAISGATNPTYTYAAGDVGKSITVELTGLGEMSAPLGTTPAGAGGSGGSSYTLPIATITVLGGLKPDGTTITVNPSTGVASASGGAAVSTTAANLMAMKKAGTLVSGTRYTTTEGWQYVAVSTTRFNPIDTAPILFFSTLTAVGDSIAANGSTGNGLSIPGWAGTHMRAAFDIQFNRGVGGYAIATVTSTQLAATVADSSDCAWVHAGVNNLRYGNATATSLEQAVADADTLLTGLAAAKQLVIWDAITPNTLVSTDGYRSVEIPELNDRIANVCAKFPNVIFNDIYSAILDTTSAIGDVDKPSTYDNIIHPNTKGAQRLGLASAKNFSQRAIIYPFYATQSTVALPDFSGTAGTLTPGSGSFGGGSVAPTNTTVSIGGTGTSVVTTTTKTYTSTLNGLNYVVANASANPNFINLALTDGTSIVGSFAVGDKIRFVCKIRVKSATNMLRLTSYLLINPGAVVVGGFQSSGTETPNVQAWGDKANTFTQRSPVYTLPSGFTSIQPNVSVQIGPTTGAADFDVMSWYIEKVA